MIEYLKDNISILEKKNVVLSSILKEFNEDDKIRVEYEDGYPNLYLEQFGHKYYLHSRYNKMEEAEEKVDIINFDMKKIIFVIGIGAGYHIRAIQDRMSEDCTLIVIEPKLSMTYKAMKYVNLKDILTHENTHFLVSEISTFEIELDKILRVCMSKISAFDIFILESTRNLFKETYENVKSDLYKVIKQARKNIGNSPLDSLIGLEHMFLNIEHLIKSGNYNNLSYTGFEDIPIVSVASGPSLNKNIKQLHKIKDKALIICCDTAYDSLIKEGIKPHIVTVVERVKQLYEKVFEDKTYPDDVLLICEGIVYPKIFECFKGRKITVLRENVALEKWGGQSSDISLLNIGPSVANLNIVLTKMFKGKCLILMGQDLAYSETGNSHAEGTIHEDNLVQNDIKSGQNIEMIEDINGNLIKTTEMWKFFLRWIQNDIKTLDVPVIDATEGGAKIEGSEVMSLENAIHKYCDKEEDINGKLKKLFKELSKEEIVDNLMQFKQNFYLQKDNIEELEKIIYNNKNRLEKLKKPKKFVPEKVNKEIIPINNDIHKIVNDYLMFYQITQSKFVDLGNANSKLSYIDESNIEEWKQNTYDFFLQLEIYLNIYKKIFDNGEKILKELEEKYAK